MMQTKPNCLNCMILFPFVKLLKWSQELKPNGIIFLEWTHFVCPKIPSLRLAQFDLDFISFPPFSLSSYQHQILLGFPAFFKFLSLHRFHQFYLSFSSFSYTQLNCGWTKGSEVWTTGTLPIEHLFSISYIFTRVSDQPY